MSQSVIFSPLLPLIWLFSLSGLAALVAIWAGWHRPVWLALRLVLIAAISFVAMGPQRVEAEHEYLNDIALLLVDKTLSMQMGQRAAI
ncbi:hypothetical protein MNBD_ALPHA06-356, partial [hydrothermal vent metagenome]